MIYCHVVARKGAEGRGRPDKCPSCGAEGSLCTHGSYSRGVVWWRDGRARADRVRIRRVRCRRCGRTHALILTSLVPYLTLSVAACLHAVVALRGARAAGVDVERRFRVSPATCRSLLGDAGRLAEALNVALDALDEALAEASRNAASLAARFALRHGTAPFSQLGIRVACVGECVDPPHT